MNKTKQRKLERVKGKVVVIGVDVARFCHTAALRLPDGLIERMLTFRNNLDGFEALATAARRCCESYGLERVVLGIEPTGHYWEALAYWWEENVGPVVLVNPMHTRRAKEMEDNSPLKSDPKDARVIAGLVAEAKYLECHLPRGVFADLRSLVSQRERCQNQRTRLINQLHQTVDRLFPEVIGEFSSLTVNSCRLLLASYPTPGELATAGVDELTDLLRKWSRGRLGRAKAERLVEMASDTVGVKEGSGIARLELKRLLEQLGLIERQRDELEQQIKELLKQTPGADLLLTVRGFGPITVASILANTGNLADYQHPEEVIKLAGLNLFEVSSGKHKGQLHISKRGRAGLRKILFMAALRVVRLNAPFAEYYQRLVNNGANRLAAVVAVMRKILRVIWSLVRNKQSFDAERLRPTQKLAEAA